MLILNINTSAATGLKQYSHKRPSDWRRPRCTALYAGGRAQKYRVRRTDVEHYLARERMSKTCEPEAVLIKVAVAKAFSLSQAAPSETPSNS